MAISLMACVTQTKKEDTKEQAIEQTVIYDENDVKITAKEWHMTGDFGPELKVSIENNSDKTLTFQTQDASINGYMVESTISENVDPEKDVEKGIYFFKTDVETSGIQDAADIQFKFHITDTKTGETVIDTDMITLKTSSADGFKYEYDESGDVIYDKDGIKVISKGLSDENSYGLGVILHVVNTTKQDITVQTCDTSINGIKMDVNFSQNVLANKHCINGATFTQTDLDANGIKNVETIEFKLHIVDKNTEKTITDSDTITLTFTK